MQLNIQDLFDLLQAQSIPDLHARVRRLTHALDFDTFLYGIRMHLGDGTSHDLILSGYPSGWNKIYDSEKYAATDPVVAHCLSSNVPLLWNTETFREAGAIAMMEAAHEYGVRSGLTMPVHSAARQTGLLSLARECTEWQKEDNFALMGQASMLAAYLHEAARLVVARKERDQYANCSLTAREKECLTWVAAGKSSWEISRIVSSSERTVNFHIGNVMRKLEVSSRSQAVAKALVIGLINP